MMFPVKVAAVSYLNTIPFIYGIEHANLLRAGLSLAPPSHNVNTFVRGDADIALIPVASVPQLDDAQIITRFCIGAKGPVRTVVLVGDTPLKEVARIWLDSHSRTSAALVRILCEQLWGISPVFEQLDDYSIIEQGGEGDAYLLIGDKVFDYEGRFRYCYDLAECWQTMTGLPFVFAVWVAREGVGQESIQALEESFVYGTEHISEAISHYGHSGKLYAYEYLTRNIDFVFDQAKRKALSLFWEMGLKFTPRANPG